MGQMPSIPSSTFLIEDVLTGGVCSTELSQVFLGALFKGDSNQALRPSDPATFLAYAEAAQHGIQAGALQLLKPKIARAGGYGPSSFERSAVSLFFVVVGLV
jgi:hypothetical protein